MPTTAKSDDPAAVTASRRAAEEYLRSAEHSLAMRRDRPSSGYTKTAIRADLHRAEGALTAAFLEEGLVGFAAGSNYRLIDDPLTRRLKQLTDQLADA